MSADLKTDLAAFLAEVRTRRYVDDLLQRRAGELLDKLEPKPAARRDDAVLAACGVGQ